MAQPFGKILVETYATSFNGEFDSFFQDQFVCWSGAFWGDAFLSFWKISHIKIATPHTIALSAMLKTGKK
jgi:hypothetical protein